MESFTSKQNIFRLDFILFRDGANYLARYACCNGSRRAVSSGSRQHCISRNACTVPAGCRCCRAFSKVESLFYTILLYLFLFYLRCIPSLPGGSQIFQQCPAHHRVRRLGKRQPQRPVAGRLQRAGHHTGEPFRRKKLYRVMIRYVAPVMMLVLFLQSTGILA